MTQELDDFPITTTEAAELIGVTPGRIRSYIFECANCGANYARHLDKSPIACDNFEGRLPAIRAGRDWRILPSDLVQFKRRPPGRPPKVHKDAVA